MLLNELYFISEIGVTGSVIRARVKINIDHPTFEGHFPNQPVLPGVCLLEMMKDIIDCAYNRTYSIIEGNNIKYLAIVDPSKSSILNFEITTNETDGLLKVSAVSSIYQGEVNFKFKGQLRVKGI